MSAIETENSTLTCEVSDEALEAMAGDANVGNYTISFCTGISECTNQ
jgi:hypothetical protein